MTLTVENESAATAEAVAVLMERLLSSWQMGRADYLNTAGSNMTLKPSVFSSPKAINSRSTVTRAPVSALVAMTLTTLVHPQAVGYFGGRRMHCR
jgi:hypothetical protein